MRRHPQIASLTASEEFFNSIIRLLDTAEEEMTVRPLALVA
jgi:hypothetical protein